MVSCRLLPAMNVPLKHPEPEKNIYKHLVVLTLLVLHFFHIHFLVRLCKEIECVIIAFDTVISVIIQILFFVLDLSCILCSVICLFFWPDSIMLNFTLSSVLTSGMSGSSGPSGTVKNLNGFCFIFMHNFHSTYT